MSLVHWTELDYLYDKKFDIIGNFNSNGVYIYGY